MNEVYLNLVFALAIGLIIYVMSLLRTGFLKAFVYSLPIPITVALIATDGHINSTHILGLYLISGFLWSVYVMKKAGLNIYIADFLAAAVYILMGYLIIRFASIPLETAAMIYAVGWFLFMLFYRSDPTETVNIVTRVNPLSKFSIVTGIAYILFSLKSLLSGIVVTFPFSGVFAVIESQNTLHTLAKVWTQNSIAILGMFLAMFYVDELSLWLRILIGWIVYLSMLLIVRKSPKFAQ